MAYTFTYPLLYRFIFRYGNIPATIIMLVYFVMSIMNYKSGLFYLAPAIIVGLLIYLLNKKYTQIYKTVPFTITIEEDKLIGSDFLFSDKKIVISFKNIDKLEGGIFERKLTGFMKCYDSKENVWMAFHSKIKKSNVLQTLILSKIREEVYNEVIEKIGLKPEDFKKKNLKEETKNRGIKDGTESKK